MKQRLLKHLLSAASSLQWSAMQIGRSNKKVRVGRAGKKYIALGAAFACWSSAVSAFAAPVETPGFLKFEYWTGMENGTAVDLLTSFDRYPNSPSIVSYIGGFNTRSVFPDDSHEQFGARISGFITPQKTGNYRFFIHSDDASQLWLSTDATEANLVMIAEEPGCCNAYTEPADGMPRTSAPIALVAGQKYFIQGLYKEGGGGDYMDVAWREEGDTTPASDLRPISGSVLSALAEPTGANVTFTTQPQSVSATENAIVTFTAAATTTTGYLKYPGGALSPVYQWYKNNVAIPGATGPTYTTPPVRIASDNGAKFKLVVSVPGLSQSSAEATLTITTDSTPPAISAASGNATFDKITLTFSEPLDSASAATAGNYSISPSLNVTGASLSGLNTVILTTSKQAPSTSYTINVNGVKDLSGNVIAAGSSIKLNSYVNVAGALQFAYWRNIPTTAVQSLLDDPRYPNNPDVITNLVAFNTRSALPTDSLENYGGRITGLLTPTKTADYRFFIYSDDASQLWLSTDATEANLVMIAEETGCCNNFTEPDAGTTRTSEPIRLEAGKQYFIQGIYKEGGGGDYMQVAWREEGDTTPAATLKPIPGSFFTAPAPPEGILVSTSPAPNSLGAAPDETIQVVHLNGLKAWETGNVTLKVDGATVPATVTKQGNVATVAYTPTTPFAQKSTHTVSLTYPDMNGQPQTQEWTFTVAPITKDKVQGYVGLLKGTATYTADGGGATGKAGDYAIDFGMGGNRQSVLIHKAQFLNAVTTNDQVSFAIWAKKNDIAANSVFWADSPTSSSGQRGFQAHLPWSDNTIYFDTAGCCDGTTQRISQNISQFPDYSGDITWWNNWRHYVFSKNGPTKQVWIDGKLFLEGTSDNPLPTDFERIWLGVEGGGPNAGTANILHGLLDDFAIFGTALTEADIVKLANKSAIPTALPASTKLVAYWDFNDATAVTPNAPTITIARDGAGIRVTYTGTLQSAPSVTGPWSDVAGGSPATITPNESQRYLRSKQ